MLWGQSCVPSKQEKTKGEQARCAGRGSLVMCSRAGAQAGGNPHGLQATASPPLLNCFEIQIFAATKHWDAGMVPGHGKVF